MAAATAEPLATLQQQQQQQQQQNGSSLDGFSVVPELRSKVDQLNQEVADPSVFFQPQASLLEAIRNAAQALFQHTANAAHQSSNFSLPLNELYVDGFDSEQIWLQLELQTEPVLKRARRLLKNAGPAPVIVSKEVEQQVDQLINAPAHGEDEDGSDEDDEDESASEREGEEADEDEDDSLDGDEDEEEEDDDLEVRRQRKRRKQGGREEGGALGGEDEDLDEDGLGSGDEDEEDDALLLGNKKKPKLRAAAVEDDFLKLGDMEKFLEASEKAAAGQLDEEGRSGSDEDEDEDEDGDLDDEDEDGNLLDKLKSKKGAVFDDDEDDGMDEDEDMEDGEEGEEGGKPQRTSKGRKEEGLVENGDASAKPGTESVPLSKHERHLQRIQAQVQALEERALAEKPWQLKGEVTAAERPMNSALEVYMDIETRAAPPPAPTEEQGQELEDVIKRRIIERRFDDPVRILPPDPPKKRKEVELDDKKSSKGLAEIYEEEYVQAVSGVSAPDKLDPLREEAKSLFKLLCGKLDALSHFHYAPKPVVEEMVVRSDVAALAMEEVAPLVVSTEAMQAPVEAHKPEASGAPQAEGELSREDRKRRRAAKKRASKAHKAQKEAERKAKGLPPLQSGNVVAGVAPVKKVEAAGKQKKSDFRSSAVFARIQDQQNGGGAAGRKKGIGEPGKSSANFKL